ncbi:hypothetical protein [Bradyrhizobium sp. CCH5-F6]|jgi:hypothetical protein|uniref:hypothetical protein n=1 Tax=Bradyrhizobium sp. CCH5-F6 TaxID=1768753 RepID=UPI000769C8E9|nr:hypothetical protein [Bradyrhizobium sp. CCH5-F6]
MSTTNTIAEPQKRFTLAEMSAVMMDRKRVPYGFFLSQKLWDHICARVTVETGGTIVSKGPITLNGTLTAVDPSLPDAEFDVAFTQEAWSRRLSSLSNGE